MLYPLVRLVVAAAALLAVAAQFERSLSIAVRSESAHASHVPTAVANYFSFFTIQSHIATALVLAIAAIWALRHRSGHDPEPRPIALLLTCVTTYMLVTGIVYNTLLRGIEREPGSTVGWSNEVLHVIVPAFLLLDALIGYRRARLPWSSAWIVAAYPVAWAVYTLLRAPFITNPGNGNPYWYPYPFLDPHVTAGGYLGVAAHIAGIAAAVVAIAFGIVAIGRRRGRPSPHGAG